LAARDPAALIKVLKSPDDFSLLLPRHMELPQEGSSRCWALGIWGQGWPSLAGGYRVRLMAFSQGWKEDTFSED
jgi:hypothetical protein